MTKSKGSTSPQPVQEKRVEPTRPKKNEPTVSQDALDQFLMDKIKPKDKKKIYKINCENLWDNRYRINVWMEEYKGEEQLFPNHYIEYSYFVYYHEGLIIDKTIAEKPKKERIF
tara:strand:- start:189 stop:530 length:342 start_codon:yes stop_codon:yes gene_type:complete